MPERVVFTPTPEPLLQLCLECRRANCSGEKCSDYRNLERKIRMNTSGKRPRNAGAQNAPEQTPVSEIAVASPQKPRMDIVPLSAPPHEAVVQAHGLKLWNLTIEALDKLLDDGDIEEVGSFAGMLKSLKRQRFELFGDRIDWHALEDE